MNKVFSLVSNDNQQVVLKVNLEDNLAVALNPYVSRDYDYITVTKGENHILTIIYKDGHTFDFHWGVGGYTLISDGLERLRKEVVRFIEEECYIPLGTNKPITEIHIFFNKNYGKWQITINNNAYMWLNTTSLEDTMLIANNYIKVKDWEKRVGSTGLDYWQGII